MIVVFRACNRVQGAIIGFRGLWFSRGTIILNTSLYSVRRLIEGQLLFNEIQYLCQPSLNINVVVIIFYLK